VCFRWEEREGIRYLTCEALDENRFLHGFTGKSLSFRDAEELLDTKRFCEAFECDDLFYFRQVHGTVIVDLRKRANIQEFLNHPGRKRYQRLPIEADAFLLSSNIRDYSDRALAFAIRTADCVPMLLKTESAIALVHAGWRGLAAGIIQKVLEYLKKENAGSELQIVVGPCAGSDLYEVGKEVILAIGEYAVFRDGRGCHLEGEEINKESFLLSLSGSAKKIVQHHWQGTSHFYISSICTMSSVDFHSFRRDIKGNGRNLCFVVI